MARRLAVAWACALAFGRASAEPTARAGDAEELELAEARTRSPHGHSHPNRRSIENGFTPTTFYKRIIVSGSRRTSARVRL